MKKDLDPILWYAEALSIKEFISEDIDALYSKNKLQMYSLGKSSERYDCSLCRRLPLKRQARFKRLICIMEYMDALPEGKEKELLSKSFFNMFKKAYKTEHSLVSNYKKANQKLDYTRILRFILDKDPTTEMLLSQVSAVLFFVLHYYGNEKVYSKFNDLLDTYIMRADNIPKFPKLCDLSTEEKEKVRKISSKLDKSLIYDLYHTAIHKNSINSSVDWLYDSASLCYLTLHEETPVDKKDVEDILISYSVFEPKLANGEIMDINDYMVFASHLKLMMKSYNSAVNLYHKTNQETLFDELKIKEEKLHQISESLQEKEYKLEQLKQEMVKTVSSISEECETLKLQNKKLLIEIEQLKKGKSELDALREFMFSQQTEDEQDLLNVETDSSCLSEINAIVIGGHPNWQNKMKELLPTNWTFISGDKRKIDKKLLEKDLIIFNTNYLNHPLYYFVMDNIENRKICYVTKVDCNACLNEIIKATEKM